MDSPRPHPAVRTLRLGLGAVLAIVAAYVGWRRMARLSATARTPRTWHRPLLLRHPSPGLLRAPGVPPGPMPALEGFARDATVYQDASASACWTAPSVTTLLTGLRPRDHGVVTFGRAAPLIPSVVTLAEMLRAGGWYTSAVTAGGWVSPDTGLGQGFDRFRTTYDEVGVGASLAGWDQARPKDRPFFLFLHTYAAHDPYGHEAIRHHGVSPVRPAASLSPEELKAGLERGGGTIPEDLVAPFVLQQLTNARGRLACEQSLGLRYKAIWHDCIPWVDGGFVRSWDPVALREILSTAYRAGLPSTDEVFGDTLDALRRLGVLDDVDLIVVGDHGEAFGEHRSLCHGFHLYDEVLRVPLIIRSRDRLPVPRIVRGGCGLIDVTPTILELAGVAPATDLPGRSLITLAKVGGRRARVRRHGAPARRAERHVPARLRLGAHPAHEVDRRVRPGERGPRQRGALRPGGRSGRVEVAPHDGAPSRARRPRLLPGRHPRAQPNPSLRRPPPPSNRPALPSAERSTVARAQLPSQRRTTSSRSESGSAPWRSTSSWKRVEAEARAEAALRALAQPRRSCAGRSCTRAPGPARRCSGRPRSRRRSTGRCGCGGCTAQRLVAVPAEVVHPRVDDEPRRAPGLRPRACRAGRRASSRRPSRRRAARCSAPSPRCRP